MLIIPKATIEVISRVTRGVLTVSFDKAYIPELEMLKGKSPTVHLTISRPKRAKKTGEGSRLNLVHLWWREIAGQLNIDEDMVKGAMKRMAVDEGWPTCLNPITGCEEPVGVAWASEDQMAIIARVTELYAALNGLALTQEET